MPSDLVNYPIYESIKKEIWILSNRVYQERIWVKMLDSSLIDSFEDTSTYFLEDVRKLLDAFEEGRVDMPESLFKSLKELYLSLEKYFLSENRPKVDGEILDDPQWIAIREKAIQVYSDFVLVG